MIIYFPAGDLVQTLLTVPKVIPDVLPCFLPYALVLGLFGAFVIWNGGIVLGMALYIEWVSNCLGISSHSSGDQANHIPSLHIPQLYYFVAFSGVLGWPVLVSGGGGVFTLMREVWSRMFGNKLYVVSYAPVDPSFIILNRRTLTSMLISSIMAATVHLFT